MTKPIKWLCAQRRLRSAWASAQSDQSSLCTQWVAKDPSFLHADSEDSDQTGWMPRLIWVCAGRTLILLVLSCCGSYYNYEPLYTIWQILWGLFELWTFVHDGVAHRTWLALGFPWRHNTAALSLAPADIERKHVFMIKSLERQKPRTEW